MGLIYHFGTCEYPPSLCLPSVLKYFQIMPKFKSKIEKVDGSSDSNQNSENEASGLNSSEEDVDFDRPTIKPPDPEGANKRKKDAKRDRGRRKRNLTPERGLQKASKFDYKREKLKR